MSSISAIYWAYRNKVTNKLWGMVRMPAQGKKKGAVLLSYITSPFTLAPWEHKSDPHSSYWESKEIARLFSVRGYEVDCINSSDHAFIPKKPYAAAIDIQQDLERLSRYLPTSCKKVIHIDNPYYKIYNERELWRLAELKKRRGAELSPKRQIASTLGATKADFIEGLGNETVHATFSEFKKPIHSIPISVVEELYFPENKDFAKARKNFIYFGGGGAILKGLDLAVEAFAGLSGLNLFIIGPAPFETDFAKAYEKELSLPNIKALGRPKADAFGHITLNGKDFREILDTAAAIIYPSSAEGTSGAVIQALHGGLVPIITPETGLNPLVGGVIMENPTVESVRETVRKFSELPEEKLRELSRTAWAYVRAHHTKQTFSKAYGNFIDNILKL